MHPSIGSLCARPDGVLDWALFEALHTRLSLDDLQDLHEIRFVSTTWSDADAANEEARHNHGQ